MQRRDIEREREDLKWERRHLDRDRHSERDRSDRKKKKRSRDDEGPRKRRKRHRTESAPVPSLAAYAPPPIHRDQQQGASFQQALQRFAQPPPSLPQKSGGHEPQKFGGHEQANYLTCAVCGTGCSGENSFKEHIASKKHRHRSRGRGFAGISPNAAGAIPAIRDPELRRAAALFGHDPDRSVAPSVQLGRAQGRKGGGAQPSGPWVPPTTFVRVSPDAQLRAKAAVDSMWFDVGSDHGGDSRRERQRTQSVAKVPDRAASDPLGDVRRSLPVFEHRTSLLEALASLTADAPCLVVEGETGSGKSTQVPQYILEEAHQHGKAVDVLVTQPRRIAAIGVADRIAAERGEQCGDSVGYAIKGEARLGPRTALTLCTTGVALRRLQGDGLEGVTHVVVDEVHERSLESDFLLLALAQLLKTRRDDLKIVLMSATMPGLAVQKYFGQGCPTVRFPGRAFPVHALYLEEALAVTRHVVRNGADWHRTSQKSERIQKRLADVERNGGLKNLQLLPRDPAECRRRGLPDACASMEENILNVDLVCDLVEWFSLTCGGDVDAAIADAARRPPQQRTATPLATLVFCAGVQDIDDVLAALRRSGRFDPNWLRPLHGALPPDDQRRVFEVPPPGVSKVVVATSECPRLCASLLRTALTALLLTRINSDVAETSITIPDVGFVVDACRVKEQRYDPQRHMASLDDVYVSRSSAKQRRGRAGRVRDGLCVHLVPRVAVERAGEAGQLETHSQPEVRRVALDQLVLRLKALPAGMVPGKTATEACASLPEPPDPESVQIAATSLMAIGALERKREEADEVLTDLGSVLAKLPVDARLGKLCVLGCVFDGCLDAALTVAASLGNRSPFMSPMERRDQADASKRAFCAFSDGPSDCGHSDLLCIRNAYDAYENAGRQKYDFARERFLGIKTLQQIALLKRQLLEALAQAGLVRNAPRTLRARDVEAMGRNYGDTDGVQACLASYGLGGGKGGPSDAVVASLVSAALFPQLAYVRAPISKKSKKACDAQNLKLEIRDPRGLDLEPQSASVHPASVRGRLDGSHWPSPYCCFHEKIRTTKVYVRDATPCPPLAPFLLTGNDLRGDTTLTLDGWLTCVVEGGGVVRDFREATLRRVSDLLSGKDLGTNGAALLAGLEALSQLEAAPLPERYKQQPPKPKPKQQPKKGGRKAMNSKWRTKGRQHRNHYSSNAYGGGSSPYAAQYGGAQW
ncbi:hypothetical protein ACHAWF_013233 [Thalassiosira exigua]